MTYSNISTDTNHKSCISAGTEVQWGNNSVDDKTGTSKPVSTAAMRALFRTLKDNIRLVVLNACYSEAQAQAIVENIDCAVGMSTEIGDQAAIIFAASFYRALGFGRSVQHAFEQGKVALLLEGIPEDKTPALLCRKGIDASKIFLVAPENRNKDPHSEAIEPMTIKTIAGKYELKEESTSASEFFRSLTKEELFITADTENPMQGTYVLLETWPPKEIWVENKRTGERQLVRKTTMTEHSGSKGILRLSGSTLKFERTEYTDTDGKSTYDRWAESKDISVSLDNPRILIMRDESGLVEIWERKY
jgi:hypothetical protein